MEFNIPPASEVSSLIEKNIKNKDKSPEKQTEVTEDKAKHIVFLQKASDKYEGIIMGMCSDAIKEAIKGCKTRITLTDLATFIKKDTISFDGKVIPVHVLHYGHRVDGYWTHRNKLEVESGFIAAQRKLKRLGYYLLDESDPTKSFGIFINLYFTEPDPDRTTYNKPDLWHKLNLISKDL